MLGLLSGGFIQAVRMCLDTLGFAADAEIRTSQEVAVATAPIETPIGVIEPGLVAGQRFIWEALVEPRPRQPTLCRPYRRQLADGRRAPPSPPGPSAPRVSGSRSRSRATPTPSSPSRAGSPETVEEGLDPQSRRRRHGHALRELDPVRRTPPTPASRPTWTCRSSPGGRTRTCAERRPGPACNR